MITNAVKNQGKFLSSPKLVKMSGIDHCWVTCISLASITKPLSPEVFVIPLNFVSYYS